MSRSVPSPDIPTFYLISFTIIDPLIALFGAITDLFFPSFALSAFLPPTIAAYNPLYGFLQHQLAGALFMAIVVDLFLLRKIREVRVWDPVQAGQLVWDAVMIVSQVFSIWQQGRLRAGPGGLRSEDWGGLALTGGIGLVRIFFLRRVGFKKDWEGKKRM